MRFNFTTVCCIALCQLSYASSGDDLAQWLSWAGSRAESRLYDNISPEGTAKGAVVASPSKDNPDYFYHWVRDASLVMDFVITRYGEETNPKIKQDLETKILDNIEFNRMLQTLPNPSGNVGEPRFMVDGTAYWKEWGRPQNDGPALRAMSYVHLANIWIAEGKTDLVKSKLYDGSWNSLLKTDLEYVSHHWQDICVDLWEESHGHHFYTQMVQRRALLEGAKLVSLLGDSQASDWYQSQAQAIEGELGKYWDEGQKFILITRDKGDGVPWKTSLIDSAVILASNHANTAATDDKMLATAIKIEEVFKNLYPVNAKNVGVAIGRYPEDRYNGNGLSQGNPWFINTNALAEFYFRVAKEYENEGTISVNAINFEFFESLGVKNKDTFASVVDKLCEKGESFLARTRFHMGEDGHMSEEMDRVTGYMTGARDLTWSYASLLTAIRAHDRACKY